MLVAAVGSLVALLVLELAVRAGVRVREVGPSFTEWHAQDGMHVRRSLDARRIHPEFLMRIRTNAAGYRGPELPERIERSIVCLGDSFTFGYGVDDDAAFPSRIAERAPPGWTTVNAGLGGAGNGRWLHVLERERERLRPRVVVLQVCGNDPADNLAERLYTLDSEGGLVAHAPAPPSWSRRVQATLDRLPGVSYLHVVGLARQVFSGSTRADSKQRSFSSGSTNPASGGEPGLDLTVALVARAVDMSRAMGATPVLILCEPSPPLRLAMLELSSERALACLSTPTKAERPELYFGGDGHWNAAGHAFVADVLWEELRTPRYGLTKPAGAGPGSLAAPSSGAPNAAR